MKAKLLRPLVGRDPADPEVNAEFPAPPQQDQRGDWIWPAGTVIDHWQSYRLVQQGVALPADAECVEAAARSPEQLAAAQYAYERLSRGIHPEDFERYDRGEIAGYNPDGSFVPGPNAQTFDDGTEETDEEAPA